PEIVLKYGYRAEEHSITTKDGYILTIHRIPNPQRPVVFLQHGLFGSSSDWILLGPNKGLGIGDDFHEVGVLDLPAMIDYILGVTEEKSLYYVGHSMGGSVVFVMGSLLPEYNSKIRIAMALAPGAFFTKSSNIYFRLTEYSKVGYVSVFVSSKFHQYHHGRELNLKYYKSQEPPEYNLTAITMPISIHAGVTDSITTIKVR
ncbi:hypothetical protein C0J52_27903, partial [Blattella germanica]